jgi:2-keto-4-pentenoate hydratase/2-oxohepta-3-ene-1,7-dioic acid hydratase in catechol pathway
MAKRRILKTMPHRFALRRDPVGLGAPLRTVYCVGRNYVEHAAELGHPVPSKPLVFLKPAAAALFSGEWLGLPPSSRRVDHEVEVVAGVCGDGRIRYAVGIDFTARDLQAQAREKGDPWTLSKGFKGFAALGDFIDAVPPFPFSLSVNGAVRQRGDTREMVFSIDRLLAYVDETFGLGRGDIVYTGTPAGVGPLKDGDVVSAELGTGLSRLTLTVGRPPHRLPAPRPLRLKRAAR